MLTPRWMTLPSKHDRQQRRVMQDGGLEWPQRVGVGESDKTRAESEEGERTQES